MKTIIAILLINMVLLMYGCSSDSATGMGGGTDFPNTKTASGAVVHEDGTPASFTDVLLLPADYFPGESQAGNRSSAATTDSSGRYLLHVPDSGQFTLSAVNRFKRTRALLRGITAEDAAEDTLHFGAAQLGQPGSVKVKLPEGIAGNPGILYIEGTEIAISVGAGDTVVRLDSIPAGVTPRLCFRHAGASGVKVIVTDSMKVFSGQTVLVAPAFGEALLVLLLNTTQTGVLIPDTLYNFPFLIRMEVFGMALRQFGENGAGVRLTKNDGTALPFEVEAWDVNSGQGDVWVLLDTVYGNSMEQTLQLFCSGDTAPEATAFSGLPFIYNARRGGMVGAIGTVEQLTLFDTAAFFGAVYHLDGGTSDATNHHYDGTARLPLQGVKGKIGDALRFGKEQSVSIPSSLTAPGEVTLSAWIELDTPVTAAVELISIGGVLRLGVADPATDMAFTGGFKSMATGDLEYEMVSGGTVPVKSGWNHIAYSFSGLKKEHALYLNGFAVAGGLFTNEVVYTADRVSAIGASQLGEGFAGLIDEVRVDQTARSSSWIRLSYSNQEHGTTNLVKVLFKKEWAQ